MIKHPTQMEALEGHTVRKIGKHLNGRRARITGCVPFNPYQGTMPSFWLKLAVGPSSEC